MSKHPSPSAQPHPDAKCSSISKFMRTCFLVASKPCGKQKADRSVKRSMHLWLIPDNELQYRRHSSFAYGKRKNHKSLDSDTQTKYNT